VQTTTGQQNILYEKAILSLVFYIKFFPFEYPVQPAIYSS